MADSARRVYMYCEFRKLISVLRLMNNVLSIEEDWASSRCSKAKSMMALMIIAFKLKRYWTQLTADFRILEALCLVRLWSNSICSIKARDNRMKATH